MCCKGALSTPLKRSILMWSFSWHYEGMKEDALQKGLPAPDEAVVRELVLAKNVEAPDLATVKDFLRFKAAAGKGMIVEQTTCDSLNTFAEWLFAGFTHVTDTEINKEDRSEVYDVSIFHHLMARPDLASSAKAMSLIARRLTAKLLFLAKILITVTSSTFRDSKGSTSMTCLASFQLPAENPSNEIRTYVSWSRKFNH